MRVNRTDDGAVVTSPRRGEGWGEGEPEFVLLFEVVTPSPDPRVREDRPLPAGEGEKLS